MFESQRVSHYEVCMSLYTRVLQCKLRRRLRAFYTFLSFVVVRVRSMLSEFESTCRPRKLKGASRSVRAAAFRYIMMSAAFGVVMIACSGHRVTW